MSGERPSPGRSMQRCLIVLLIICIAFAAVAGALHVLADSSENTMEVWLGVPCVAALCFALLLTFAVVLNRGANPVIVGASVLGIVLAIGGATCIISLLTVSDGLNGDAPEALAKAGTISLALAIALAYSGALATVRTRSGLVRGVAISTGACAWLAAGLLTLMLVGEELIDNDFGTMMLMLIALGILMVLMLVGTIAVPIAAISAAAKRREAPESIDLRVQVHLGCPKCGEPQTHKPGFARCNGCGAGLFIEVEEPRCECGYLLYQLTGDTCPECGRPVAKTDDVADG